MLKTNVILNVVKDLITSIIQILRAVQNDMNYQGMIKL